MTPAATRRHASVDVLRALAIVLMVIVHFVENLAGWYGVESGPFVGAQQIWWLPTGCAAPIFTFLSGVSYRLWLVEQENRGRRDETIAKRTVRRGLFLVGLGFVFNVIVWLPEDVFNWDVLTLIGGALLVLAFARGMPDGVVLFAALLVVAVSPALRATAGYMAYWKNGYFDYDFTLSDVVLGWLVTGYFPVFPWLAFPLMGYALAPRLLADPTRTGDVPPEASAATSRAGAVTAAVAFAVVAVWTWLPPAVTGGSARAWTMFPASTAYVVGTLGTATVALGITHRLLDGDAGRCRRLVAWATPLSRHALSMYLLHHVVHVWPLWGWSAATTGDATALWQLAMSPWAALVCSLVFLVAASVACRWLDRRGVPSAESLMRWVCDD